MRFSAKKILLLQRNKVIAAACLITLGIGVAIYRFYYLANYQSNSSSLNPNPNPSSTVDNIEQTSSQAGDEIVEKGPVYKDDSEYTAETEVIEGKDEISDEDKLLYEDFFSKNEEILLPFEFETNIPDRLVVKDALKRKLRPGSYIDVFLNDVKKSYQIINTDEKIEYSKRLWGILTIEEEPYKISLNNSIAPEKLQTALKFFSQWKARSWSGLKNAINDYDISKIKKLIDAGTSTSASYEPDVYSLFLEFGDLEYAKRYFDSFSSIDPDDFKSAVFDSIFYKSDSAFNEHLPKIPASKFLLPGGLTPLGVASLVGNLSAVKLLIQSKVDIHERDSAGNSALAYVSGHDSIFSSDGPERNEILDELHKNGMGASDLSENKYSSPFRAAVQRENKTLARKLIELKLLNKDDVAGISEDLLLYSLDKIESIQLLNKKNLMNYLSEVKALSEKTDPDSIGSLARRAIRFNDKDTFKKIGSLTSNFKELKFKFTFKDSGREYKGCLIDDLLESQDTFYIQSLKPYLTTSAISCMRDLQGKNPGTFLAEKCRFSLLDTFQDSIDKEIKYDDFGFNLLSRNQETIHFEPALFNQCFKTFKVLRKHGIAFNDYDVLMKLATFNDVNLISYFLNGEVFSKEAIISAVESMEVVIENKDKYEIIGPKISSYINYYAQRNNLVLNISPETLISGNSIQFNEGHSYSLCGRYKAINLYKSPSGMVSEKLPFCFEAEASLFGTTLLNGKVSFVDDDWLKVKVEATTDIKDQDIPARTLFVKRSEVTSPFILTDGKISIALSKAGLEEIRIGEQGFTELGSEDPCHGNENPSITVGKGEQQLPAGFDVKALKLLNNLPSTITKSCGT